MLTDHFTRSLREFQSPDARIAKLFAKHIKLKDAVSFLRSTRVGIAVGTPSRVRELVELGMSPALNAVNR